VTPYLNTQQGGATYIAGHRVTVLAPRHELASHTDAAANDDRIGRAISSARTVAAVVALSGVAACVWASIGCPGLSALGLN
jgi:hypothetical protein